MWGIVGRVGSLLAPLGRMAPKIPPGGVKNLVKPGAGMAGLPALDVLMQGSNLLQDPIKNIFGVPTTGDYLRRWEKERIQSERPVGTKAVLGGREVSWEGPNLGWQRTYSEVRKPPLTPTDQSLTDPGAAQAGQQTPPLNLGGGSNGASVVAKPPNVQKPSLSQEVLNAAQQFAAPAGVPLSSFYAGQQQLGRSMKPEDLALQLRELGGAAGITDPNLTSWVKQNPGLAYREMLKLKERGL